MNSGRFEVELVSGHPKDLKPGVQAVLEIKLDGKPWGGDAGKHGCEVLRVFQTDEAYTVWCKSWIGQNLKVRFPKEGQSKGVGEEEAKGVDSADPVERAIADPAMHEEVLAELAPVLEPVRDRIGVFRRPRVEEEKAGSEVPDDPATMPAPRPKLRLVKNEDKT